jgi:hypothetical protein
MTEPTNPDNPPSRGMRVMKALILLAVSIKMFTSVAPNHGSLFAVVSGLLVLGAIIYLIITIISIF